MIDDAQLPVLVPRLLLAVMLLAGLASFARGHLDPRDRVKIILDVTTVLGGSLALGWFFVVGPMCSREPPPSTVSCLVTVLRVLVDVALLLVAATLVFRGAVVTLRRPSALLMLSAVAYLVGDVVIARRHLGEPAGDRPWWLGVLDLSPYVLFAAAAVERRWRRPGHPEAFVRSHGVFALVVLQAVVAGGYALLAASVIRDDVPPRPGLVAAFVIMMVAVSARQVITVRENDRLAVTDALTGLANRSQLRTAMLRCLPRHARPGGLVALLLLDLDGFKQINDAHGYDAGDALLTAVADVLRRGVRPGDVVARLGGDEFAVFLNGISDELDAVAVARRVLAEIHRPIVIGGNELVAGGSIGIALAELPDERPTTVVATELMSRADVAMYTAKRSGRNRWRVYSPGAVGHGDAQLGRDLVIALAERQFQLVYQPLIDLGDGDLAGIEALLRWEHPTRGLLTPDAFLPLVQESDVIHKLGIWVLREACSQVRTWQETLPDGQRLSLHINVAPIQLRLATFPEDLLDVLATTGLDAGQLVLDVAEQLVDGESRARAVLATLRSHGVRVALDGVGTAPVSLGRMARFPVDVVKLDRSFVSGLPGDPEAATVASMVLRLGETMCLQAIAVGVETPQQATEVTELGYHQAQGAYFCSPLGPELMSAWIPRWGYPSVDTEPRRSFVTRAGRLPRPRPVPDALLRAAEEPAQFRDLRAD